MKTLNGEKLVEAFDEAASAYGWSSDQGSETESQKDLIRYAHTKNELLKYIKKLEAKQK